MKLALLWFAMGCSLGVAITSMVHDFKEHNQTTPSEDFLDGWYENNLDWETLHVFRIAAADPGNTKTPQATWEEVVSCAKTQEKDWARATLYDKRKNYLPPFWKRAKTHPSLEKWDFKE